MMRRTVILALLMLVLVSAGAAHTDVSSVGHQILLEHVHPVVSWVGQNWCQSVVAISPLLSDYLTLDQCAEELGKHRRTLLRWLKARIGPPVTYIGKTLMYRRDGVREWLRAQEQPMVREAQRAAKARSRAERGKKPALQDRRRRREAEAAQDVA